MVANLPPLVREIGGAVRSHTMVSILVLSVSVLTLEVAQAWPEIVPGGHVASVFSRSILYSLIAALIFNLVVIEIPRRRRSRIVYRFNEMAFTVLLSSGPTLLTAYREALPRSNGDNFDAWSRESVRDRVRKIADTKPEFFNVKHRRLLMTQVMGVKVAIDGIRPAQAFLGEDVAHALAMFPSDEGVQQLQVQENADGSVPWHSAAHIAWELTVAARRLNSALKKEAPEITVSLSTVNFEGGVELPVPEEYLAERP